MASIGVFLRRSIFKDKMDGPKETLKNDKNVSYQWKIIVKDKLNWQIQISTTGLYFAEENTVYQFLTWN